MNEVEKSGVEDYKSVLDRVIEKAKGELHTRRYSEINNTYTVRPEGVQYEIPLDELTTPQQLLGWIARLSDKTWFDNDSLFHLVHDIAKLRGWDINV